MGMAGDDTHSSSMALLLDLGGLPGRYDSTARNATRRQLDLPELHGFYSDLWDTMQMSRSAMAPMRTTRTNFICAVQQPSGSSCVGLPRGNRP